MNTPDVVEPEAPATDPGDKPLHYLGLDIVNTRVGAIVVVRVADDCPREDQREIGRRVAGVLNNPAYSVICIGENALLTVHGCAD